MTDIPPPVAIPVLPDDDERFITIVSQVTAGCIAAYKPRMTRIYKVDNWFDHKWLEFSGRILGALGVWKTGKNLMLPPFKPERIVTQWRSRHDSNQNSSPGLRVSNESYHRGNVSAFWPSTAFFWFSGNTVSNGRGSMMAYVPAGEEHWPWFVALTRGDAGWNFGKTKNIDVRELSYFFEAHN